MNESLNLPSILKFCCMLRISSDFFVDSSGIEEQLKRKRNTTDSPKCFKKINLRYRIGSIINKGINK
tara:strand:- start:671 stop:871 length:201 start_codon:yes stop_codon:yes gene_type:complete